MERSWADEYSYEMQLRLINLYNERIGNGGCLWPSFATEGNTRVLDVRDIEQGIYERYWIDPTWPCLLWQAEVSSSIRITVKARVLLFRLLQAIIKSRPPYEETKTHYYSWIPWSTDEDQSEDTSQEYYE